MGGEKHFFTGLNGAVCLWWDDVHFESAEFIGLVFRICQLYSNFSRHYNEIEDNF